MRVGLAEGEVAGVTIVGKRLTRAGNLEEPNTLPPPRPGDTWGVRLDHPLHSAYAAALGREPEFTNYNKVRRGVCVCSICTSHCLWHPVQIQPNIS